MKTFLVWNMGVSQSGSRTIDSSSSTQCNDGPTDDRSIAQKRDCAEKYPQKDAIAGTSTPYVTKNTETSEEAKRRKRMEKLASYSLMDPLKQKERHKLLSSDSVLSLNGSSFVNAMLKIHNAYRADHGVPPLKLNKELNKLAQKRAVALVIISNRSSNIMECVPTVPPTVSENVFNTVSDIRAVPGAALACAEWYSCARNFHYDNCQKKIGRKRLAFMNVIWKTTSELGAGRAVSGSGNVVIIALYFPKPEIPNGIAENVFPPICEDI